jgi:hypothetical protein
MLAALIAVVSGSASPLQTAEKTTYPAPRFPSYVKPPKSIDDVMPFARAAVRQTGGRTPLLFEKQSQIPSQLKATADKLSRKGFPKA